MGNNTVDQFYANLNNTEDVVLEQSGITVKIKAIGLRKYSNLSFFPVDALRELENNTGESESEERQLLRLAKLWERLPEDKKEAIELNNNKMIVAAAVDPEISLTKEDGKICIDDIPDKDYEKLLSKVREKAGTKIDVNPS